MTYGALFSTQLVTRGDFAGALRKATEEILADPSEPEAYFNRGQARAGLQQFDEAVADYQQALSMDASASALDVGTLDDELFDALRLWALLQKDNPQQAIDTIARYQLILPDGRHLDDVAKWRATFMGEETVWYRNRS